MRDCSSPCASQRGKGPGEDVGGGDCEEDVAGYNDVGGGGGLGDVLIFMKIMMPMMMVE